MMSCPFSPVASVRLSPLCFRRHIGRRTQVGIRLALLPWRQNVQQDERLVPQTFASMFKNANQVHNGKRIRKSEGLREDHEGHTDNKTNDSFIPTTALNYVFIVLFW